MDVALMFDLQVLSDSDDERSQNCSSALAKISCLFVRVVRNQLSYRFTLCHQVQYSRCSLEIIKMVYFLLGTFPATNSRTHKLAHQLFEFQSRTSRRKLSSIDQGLSPVHVNSAHVANSSMFLKDSPSLLSVATVTPANNKFSVGFIRSRVRSHACCLQKISLVHSTSKRYLELLVRRWNAARHRCSQQPD